MEEAQGNFAKFETEVKLRSASGPATVIEGAVSAIAPDKQN